MNAAKESLRLIKVNASAGSGKTWWLVSRFFSLLRNAKTGAISPSGQQKGALETLGTILGITFTNAAAAEMRARIIERLKNAALGIGEDRELSNATQAEAWLEAILTDYGSLNFRTIDSLLHLLARSSALELGLNPDFETAFDLSEIFDPWLGEIFEAGETDPALRRKLSDIFRLAQEDGSIKGFLSGGKIQEKILKILGPVLLGEFDRIATAEELEAIKSRMEAKTEKALALSGQLLNLADEEKVSLLPKAREALEKFTGGDLDFKSAYFDKTDFSQLCKNNSKPSSRLLSIFAAWAPLISEFRKNDRPVLKCVNRARSMLGLIEIAKILARRFEKDKGAARLLPHILIPSLAARIMREGMGVSDAICRLGTTLNHFLIDEFQDTSASQWDAVKELGREALGTGGSFSAVGDGKQSIYSWRGGDPDIFANLLEDANLATLVRQKEKDCLNLPKNHRSAPAIVEHNNQLFSVPRQVENAAAILEFLLPQDLSPLPADMISSFKTELAAKLAQIYENAEQKPGKKSKHPGTVEYLEIRHKSEKEIWRQSIDATRRLIKDRLRHERPYSDILILCRSNSNCLDIARELIRHKIPVITENSLLLSEHRLIVQTLALLRFLNNRGDGISFWTLVRGSIINTHPEWRPAGNEELEAWLGERKRENLAGEFAKAFPDIWKKFFTPFLEKKPVLSAYDLVREWFAYLDVEQRFPEDGTFIRRFLEILHKAEADGAMSAAAFLDFWDASGGEEKAPMPENANAVQIMTIHKAKGLQNKVVIVPKTNFTLQNPRETGLVEIDGARVPVSLGNKVAGRQYLEKYASQALETMNILYVAFTRAAEELYYFINLKEKSSKSGGKKKEDKAPSLMHLLLEKIQGKPGELVLPEENIDAEAGNQTEDGPQEAKPLARDWQPMEWLPRLKIYRAHPSLENLTAVERGNFTHRCLERLNLSKDAEKAAEAAFNATLREAPYSIPENQRSGLLRNLQWFAKLPFSARWLEKGWREQSLATAEGELLRPDLLVPDGDAALVLDYKTGDPEPGHIAQMRKYLINIEKTGLFPGEIRGCLVYLDKRAFIGMSADSHTELTKDPARAGLK